MSQRSVPLAPGHQVPLWWVYVWTGCQQSQLLEMREQTLYSTIFLASSIYRKKIRDTKVPQSEAVQPTHLVSEFQMGIVVVWMNNALLPIGSNIWTLVSSWWSCLGEVIEVEPCWRRDITCGELWGLITFTYFLFCFFTFFSVLEEMISLLPVSVALPSCLLFLSSSLEPQARKY